MGWGEGERDPKIASGIISNAFFKTTYHSFLA